MNSSESQTLHLASSNIFAGTSGWAYPSWKPSFYPARTSPKKFLEFYASRLNSVEVNYTFRSLPSTAMLQGWIAAVPGSFRFSFKAPQRITHFARLANCVDEVEKFSNALDPVRASGKLGILLFQLPPNFKANPDLLSRFLRIKCLSDDKAPQLAFEFRHESWFTEETYAVLRSHNVALCIAEGENHSTPEVHSAQNFACFRMRLSGGYSPEQLSQLASKYLRLAQERTVYAYFKHEEDATGPLNASSILSQIAVVEGGR